MLSDHLINLIWNKIKILQHYYCELDAAGANLDQYSFDDLVKDYRICLWLAAALYAIPNIYDRGTVTDENETAAEEVRSALRRNLQPILDEEVFYRKMWGLASVYKLQKYKKDFKRVYSTFHVPGMSSTYRSRRRAIRLLRPTLSKLIILLHCCSLCFLI